MGMISHAMTVRTQTAQRAQGRKFRHNVLMRIPSQQSFRKLLSFFSFISHFYKWGFVYEVMRWHLYTIGGTGTTMRLLITLADEYANPVPMEK